MASKKSLFSVKKVDLSVNRFGVVGRFYSTFALSKKSMNYQSSESRTKLASVMPSRE
jgi:hypothetical protein